MSTGMLGRLIGSWRTYTGNTSVKPGIRTLIRSGRHTAGLGTRKSTDRGIDMKVTWLDEFYPTKHGKNQYTNNMPGRTTQPSTIADLGISKDESARARFLTEPDNYKKQMDGADLLFSRREDAANS